MVEPDRVVQHQRAVAVAPGIPGTRVLLDDQRRHAQLLQPGAHGDAGLAAADDEAVRLDRVAHGRRLPGARFRPGLAVTVGPVHGTERPTAADRFLVTLEVAHGREEGPGLAVLQANDALTQCHIRLEGEPRLDHAVDDRGIAAQRERSGPGRDEGRCKHLRNRRRPLQGLDVPGEGEDVAPIALAREPGQHLLDVAFGQALLEALKPGCCNDRRVRVGRCGQIGHGVTSLIDRTRQPSGPHRRLCRKARAASIARDSESAWQSAA